jgi:hypothetical protein
VPQETCAALVSAYPVIFLAIIIESRQLPGVVRRSGVYVVAVGAGSISGLIGFVVVTLGAATGLHGGWEFLGWCAFGVTVAAMALVLLMLGYQEDRDQGRGNGAFHRWLGRRVLGIK